ncbi:unnamed protein product [Clonostachys rosea]|uniref:Zn(2)-C6 fungal-type domain-containing protein n=1 Tax=Bionectria ochroleuca TaxID=29856 RepID=A0ABY6U5E4_BIOOC|nr:unnamed protein product [Clonostachys rosea]
MASTFLPNAREAVWADNRSMPSEEGAHDLLPAQIRMATWDGQSGITKARSVPLALTSTNMDLQPDISSVPTLANSTASSCAGSWSSGNADRDDTESDLRWEQGSDDALTVPKLEPTEEDFSLETLQSPPAGPPALSDLAPVPQGKLKRPRGRPRKHPITPVINANKVTKGRSKTGCITCRKRKKKCDEAKPRCMNCEKNAVVCEGYHEKQIWKSGKEKAEEERLRQEALPLITMQPLFHGVETVEDKIFWKHYINHFSNVLTVEGEAKNAFKDIILHLANRHQGLMHAILSVSSKHIDFDAPYGAKIIQENPATNRQALQSRSDYHHDEAIKRFYEDIANAVNKEDPEYLTEEYQTTLSARYGQILCRLLQTLTEGNTTGEHRLHLQAYQTLMQHSPPQDTMFSTFITEFFQYHIYADDLMWHPETRINRLSLVDWQTPTSIQTPRLLGVADGLLQHLTEITTLRNTIRDNMTVSNDPPVDYIMLFRAAEINTAIQEWVPRWPPGDSRNRVGLLYKQMLFIYLFRTIYPPSMPLRQRPSSFSSMSSLCSTPQRRPSMAASVVSTASAPVLSSLHSQPGNGMPHSCPSSRNPSRNNSMHEGDTSSSSSSGLDSLLAQSPPPKRRPSDDQRLTTAVEESLNIFETFSSSEPAQTLLLIPCMLVGIACFATEQRDRLRRALRAVRGYTGLRNCDRIAELLEAVWAFMDEGEWVSVWDWQGVAQRLGIDILCT